MIRCVAIASILLAANAAVTLPVPVDGFWDDETFNIRSDVRLVLLDVSVKDHAGTFVAGLTKDDFSVFEDGREQQIKIFTNRDTPVTAGVIVDNSLSMSPKRYEVLKAAQLFVRESNAKDEMFVINFNDHVRWGLPDRLPFSSDPKQLHEALYRGKPVGKTALNDAMIAGLKHLQTGSRDRRTLLLISDGGDNASKPHSRQELLQLVESNVATIYTIGLLEPGGEDQDPAILKKLAKISGGEAYFPKTLEEMSDICSAVARDIRQRYTVGYTPKPRPSAGATRQIRLRVKGPGNAKLIARARTSYRYDDAEILK